LSKVTNVGWVIERRFRDIENNARLRAHTAALRMRAMILIVLDVGTNNAELRRIRCVYRKPYPVEGESDSRKLIG